MEKTHLSKISIVHTIKLVYRGLLFLAAVAAYIVAQIRNEDLIDKKNPLLVVLLGVIWVVFVAEMMSRMFPSPLESMGCEKQFRRNYKPVEGATPRLQSGRVTFAVAFVWIALNALFGGLYLAGIFDRGLLLLIALAYSVCDMICILFFCPFQTWFMKNKCCTTCRIYNWDYAMMFTPFVFIPSVYTWTLLGLAVVLLVLWEVRVHLAPQRFCECSNDSLACKNCKEKLCHHKRQLRRFWKTQTAALSERREKIEGKVEQLEEKLKNRLPKDK